MKYIEKGQSCSVRSPLEHPSAPSGIYLMLWKLFLTFTCCGFSQNVDKKRQGYCCESVWQWGRPALDCFYPSQELGLTSFLPESNSKDGKYASFHLPNFMKIRFQLSSTNGLRMYVQFYSNPQTHNVILR